MYTNGIQDWSERSVRQLTRIPDKKQAARVAAKVIEAVEKNCCANRDQLPELAATRHPVTSAEHLTRPRTPPKMEGLRMEEFDSAKAKAAVLLLSEAAGLDDGDDIYELLQVVDCDDIGSFTDDIRATADSQCLGLLQWAHSNPDSDEVCEAAEDLKQWYENVFGNH